MKKLLALLLLFGIVGCTTVTYDSNILPPSASSTSYSQIGFGPFEDLMGTLAGKYQAVHVTPFIPLNQKKAFRRCYPLSQTEEIYAIVNTSITLNTNNSGCVGFVFTDKGVHSNPASLSLVQGQSFFPYSTLYSYSTKYIQDQQGLMINQGHVDAEVDMDDKDLYNVFVTARNRSKLNEYKYYKPPSKDLKIKQIPKEILSLLELSGMDGLYTQDNIPEIKESSFRKCTGISSQSEILMYLDGTFFGSGGCAGMGFLSDGIVIHNGWIANYPGTYYFAYDFLVGSDFIPYIKGIDLYIEKNIAFDFSGVNLNGSSVEYAEYLLQMFKGFKGQVEISNEDALRLASQINPLPNAPVISYASSKSNQSNIKKAAQKPKPQKKEEGMSLLGKIFVAAIGIYIASEIIDELNDDSSSSSSSYKAPKPSTSSGRYDNSGWEEVAQDLLDRQSRVSNQRAKQQRKYELVNTLTNTVSKRGGDTTTAYLTISDMNNCSYGFGSNAFKIAKGISPCPMNIQVPVGSGVFDSSQMNYNSSSSLKTTWYLDLNLSTSTSCVYKYGGSTRRIPKGGMCPSSHDF